jgi:phosphoenolpyruvate carboxykinase (GTP)
MINRAEGRVSGVETPIGILPGEGELKLDGLTLDRAHLDELLDVDPVGWQAELAAIGEYLQSFTPRLPERLHQEQQRVASALGIANDRPRREASAS